MSRESKDSSNENQPVSNLNSQILEYRSIKNKEFNNKKNENLKKKYKNKYVGLIDFYQKKSEEFNSNTKKYYIPFDREEYYELYAENLEANYQKLTQWKDFFERFKNELEEKDQYTALIEALTACVGIFETMTKFIAVGDFEKYHAPHLNKLDIKFKYIPLLIDLAISRLQYYIDNEYVSDVDHEMTPFPFHFSKLPSDLLNIILSSFKLKELAGFRLISSFFKNAINQIFYEKLNRRIEIYTSELDANTKSDKNEKDLVSVIDNLSSKHKFLLKAGLLDKKFVMAFTNSFPGFPSQVFFKFLNIKNGDKNLSTWLGPLLDIIQIQKDVNQATVASDVKVFLLFTGLSKLGHDPQQAITLCKDRINQLVENSSINKVKIKSFDMLSFQILYYIAMSYLTGQEFTIGCAKPMKSDWGDTAIRYFPSNALNFVENNQSLDHPVEKNVLVSYKLFNFLLEKIRKFENKEFPKSIYYITKEMYRLSFLLNCARCFRKEKRYDEAFITYLMIISPNKSQPTSCVMEFDIEKRAKLSYARTLVLFFASNSPIVYDREKNNEAYVIYTKLIKDFFDIGCEKAAFTLIVRMGLHNPCIYEERISVQVASVLSCSLDSENLGRYLLSEIKNQNSEYGKNAKQFLKKYPMKDDSNFLRNEMPLTISTKDAIQYLKEVVCKIETPRSCDRINDALIQYINRLNNKITTNNTTSTAMLFNPNKTKGDQSAETEGMESLNECPMKRCGG